MKPIIIIMIITFIIVIFGVLMNWFLKHTLRGEQGVGLFITILVAPYFGAAGILLFYYLLKMVFVYYL